MAIHPTAIIHPEAKVDPSNEIGPYCVIGAQVILKKNNKLHPHVVISGDTEIGEGNQFFSFSYIGGSPQDLKYKGENTKLIIGNNNTIRECVTLNLGTVTGTGVTKIGNHNLIMAYCHFGHDCDVGNYNVFANTTNLAGHVTVNDWAVFGGACYVGQFLKVGAHAYLGGGSFVERDVVPYSTGFGNRFRVKGINIVGLKRRGFTKDQIRRVLDVHKIIYRQGLQKEEYLREIQAKYLSYPEIKLIYDFIVSSESGICSAMDEGDEPELS